ncbi:MAG: helix-hairpin-helix domain-containing protein [Candidatus Omnitrophota bacterium]
MLNFTTEERKVALFLLGLAFCGLILNNLIKVNARVEKLVYPQVELAKLNLNKISLSEISKVKGVSLKLGERIIEYRSLHKEFRFLEELKEVKGIGRLRYERLKEVFFI